MKKNILKLLSLMLALLTISAAFFACSVTDDGDVTTDVVTDAPGENDPVPHLDWGGRPFRVLTTNNSVQPNFEVVGEVGTDRLSKAVYERNVAVKEYCNVEIIDVSGNNDDNFEAIESDFMAGTKNYDLAFLLRNEMSSAIQRGFMKDLNKVEYYQFIHFTNMCRDYLEILEDVDKEWKRIDEQYNVPYFPHVSCGWDNNPRYRKFRPVITNNNTPENFEKGLRMAKDYVDNHPEQVSLVTINSWNEWTETSYLLPDNVNGYGYLDAIKKVFKDEQ